LGSPDDGIGIGHGKNAKRLEQSAKQFRKIDSPIKFVLIGGAAVLLTDVVKRVTADIDIVDSGLSLECGLL